MSTRALEPDHGPNGGLLVRLASLCAKAHPNGEAGGSATDHCAEQPVCGRLEPTHVSNPPPREARSYGLPLDSSFLIQEWARARRSWRSSRMNAMQYHPAPSACRTTLEGVAGFRGRRPSVSVVDDNVEA